MQTNDEAMTPILPVGTRVVTQVAHHGADGVPTRPAGAMGTVIQSPTDPSHAYRVRFPSGEQGSYRRRDLVLYTQHQRGAALDGPDAEGLEAFIIYRCVTGSRAYGLDGAGSDTDRRGIYLPPAARHWSLAGVPEQVENPRTEEVYWELEKFLRLGLKANPNILECLYTPLVEFTAPPADGLLSMREVFLSKLIYQTYNGYVLSQFHKLEADRRRGTGEIRPKHLMHLIRLLLQGIGALRDGTLTVRVAEHRDELLAIRRGDLPFDEVDRWRRSLHTELDRAFEQTALPERPDYDRVNRFLIDARRRMVEDR